ncbi:uncharacterized protein LOC124145220 [Haliotis rufescens]|uniref:uncharacterized protein LOC124145220 n=1 Tax=Haliotis rufescens TaxID=6454 RepID=UPI00201F3537|nr:uncharacterized protein LOC124145220 [Haliotis rufescens]XP_046370887.2 uncharacterized protein LOC124145220 [Haliotis rufescens]XP_046370888.2 uncharacterized protein LOC124145220 [Haliotis rufescens]XP_046370889.2 uncharacterized protein LOC124145220 [Haliotis rufescens]XP_048239821.1 uncharacterized protein LOC124145220 [Haliotis rufescens]
MKTLEDQGFAGQSANNIQVADKAKDSPKREKIENEKQHPNVEFIEKNKENVMENVDSGGNNIRTTQCDQDQPKTKESNSKTKEHDKETHHLSTKDTNKRKIPFNEETLEFRFWMQYKDSNLEEKILSSSYEVYLSSTFLAEEVGMVSGLEKCIQKQFSETSIPYYIKSYEHEGIRSLKVRIALVVIPTLEISSSGKEEPNFQLLQKYLSALFTDSETHEGHRSKVLEAFDVRRFRVAHEQQLSRLLLHRYSFQEILNTGTRSEQGQMWYENLRLRSFYGVCIEASPLRLVAAGFYATGDGDETRCFSCGVTHRNWTGRDNPFEIHAAVSPSCNHVLDTDDNNVSIQDTNSPEHLATECPLVGDTQNNIELNAVPADSTTPFHQTSASKYEHTLSSINTYVHIITFIDDGHRNQLDDIAALRSRFEALIEKTHHKDFDGNARYILEKKDNGEEESEQTRDKWTCSQGPRTQTTGPGYYPNSASDSFAFQSQEKVKDLKNGQTRKKTKSKARKDEIKLNITVDDNVYWLINSHSPTPNIQRNTPVSNYTGQ